MVSCLLFCSLNPTHQGQKKYPLSIVWLCEIVDFMERKPQSESLLAAVEEFLKREQLSATRFGVLAAGDTKFVSTLRNGRKLRATTETRVRNWMSEQAGA